MPLLLLQGGTSGPRPIVTAVVVCSQPTGSVSSCQPTIGSVSSCQRPA